MGLNEKQYLFKHDAGELVRLTIQDDGEIELECVREQQCEWHVLRTCMVRLAASCSVGQSGLSLGIITQPSAFRQASQRINFLRETLTYPHTSCIAARTHYASSCAGSCTMCFQLLFRACIFRPHGLVLFFGKISARCWLIPGDIWFLKCTGRFFCRNKRSARLNVVARRCTTFRHIPRF